MAFGWGTGIKNSLSRLPSSRLAVIPPLSNPKYQPGSTYGELITGSSMVSGTYAVPTYPTEIALPARIAPDWQAWQVIGAQGACSPTDSGQCLLLQLWIHLFSN